MTLRRDGALRFRAALPRDDLDVIDVAISDLPPGKAGIRLTGVPALSRYLSLAGAIGAIAGSALGEQAKPVRAILFDKTAATNWRLGWHQDRTIAVRTRAEVPGYGPWSTK